MMLDAFFCGCSRSRAGRLWVGGGPNSPGLLLFLAPEVHGHHSPRQIFHPLLVGQFLLGLAVQFPHLRRQWVFLLHFIGGGQIGAGGIVLPSSKEGFGQELVTSAGGFG